MKAEQQILIAKKRLSPPGDRFANSLSIETQAIAHVLDNIIAKQNQLAAKAAYGEPE